MRHLTLGLLAAAVAGAAIAQPMPAADPHRPAEDVARDAARHPAEMLAFAHVGPGTKVVDFIAGHGYFTRLFAVAVKPGGSVVAVVPQQVRDHDPAALSTLNAIAAEPAYGDVTVVAGLLDPAVRGADVIWTAQNYHDLHNAPPELLAGANRAVFAALKPGGYYVIIDHAAAPGARRDQHAPPHRSRRGQGGGDRGGVRLRR